MSLCSLALLALLGAGQSAAEQIIDDFQYPAQATARQAWTAAEGTPPVELKADGLVLKAPFAAKPNLSRVVIDRHARLDLAMPGEFVLQAASDAPEAFGNITLYFHSGRGWYAAHASLGRKGTQTLHFSKGSFTTEDSPAGWDQIDGIRIAAWHGKAEDAALRFVRLAAMSHDVALVIPGKASKDDSERRTATETAHRVTDMLTELGLGADALDDTAVARGALGNRRVAILAYHEHLPDAADAALVRFVEAGGKVLVCYTLPPRLGAALGFGNSQHVRGRPGQFAKIRFDAEIPGLPTVVQQASWNITVAKPAGHDARVIGRWFTELNQSTGQPAMLLSDRGAFFSHIILGDDPDGKKQMLAAILGHLAPPLWQRMAEAEIERAGKVGHCEDLKELAAYLEKQLAEKVPFQRDTEALRRLMARGQALLEQSKKQLADKAYNASSQSARQSHAALVDVYLSAAPSPAREGRAMWNHSGTGAYPGDWDRTAKLLAANGFNMVLPNMLWGGVAHYPSDVLPRSETFRRYGDQIAECVAAGKKHGVEVHVWKVNFNLSTAPKEFVERLRRQGRTQVSFRGEPVDWLCPSHPENQKLELESMLEVAQKYQVTGLHFDYIRYPNHESCYCDGCRQRFEAQSGQPVADWPRECYSGARKNEFNQWRCQQITALVAAVRRETKKLRPELKLSAAVFGAYPACRESVAQDWPEWVKAGYLDFVCPMDYSNSDASFAGWVENQVKLVAGRIPIYPGIGATASNSALSADRVVGQIYHARRLGTAGFCIFNLDGRTAETIVPGVGRGVGRQPAVPPHAR